MKWVCFPCTIVVSHAYWTNKSHTLSLKVVFLIQSFLVITVLLKTACILGLKDQNLNLKIYRSSLKSHTFWVTLYNLAFIIIYLFIFLQATKNKMALGNMNNYLLYNKTRHSYIYMSPIANGWTECAEIFSGHSGVPGGCFRL